MSNKVEVLVFEMCIKATKVNSKYREGNLINIGGCNLISNKIQVT